MAHLAEPAPTEKQPLLPRFRMIWFFVVAVIVALALFVVRAADQGDALAAASLLTIVFFSAVCLFSGGCFVVAFLFGSMEKAMEGEVQSPSSPFIDGSLPDQIVPPKPAEDA